VGRCPPGALFSQRIRCTRLGPSIGPAQLPVATGSEQTYPSLTDPGAHRERAGPRKARASLPVAPPAGACTARDPPVSCGRGFAPRCSRLLERSWQLPGNASASRSSAMYHHRSGRLRTICSSPQEQARVSPAVGGPFDPRDRCCSSRRGLRRCAAGACRRAGRELANHRAPCASDPGTEGALGIDSARIAQLSLEATPGDTGPRKGALQIEEGRVGPVPGLADNGAPRPDLFVYLVDTLRADRLGGARGKPISHPRSGCLRRREHPLPSGLCPIPVDAFLGRIALHRSDAGRPRCRGDRGRSSVPVDHARRGIAGSRLPHGRVHDEPELRDGIRLPARLRRVRLPPFLTGGCGERAGIRVARESRIIE